MSWGLVLSVVRKVMIALSYFAPEGLNIFVRKRLKIGSNGAKLTIEEVEIKEESSSGFKAEITISVECSDPSAISVVRTEILGKQDCLICKNS